MMLRRTRLEVVLRALTALYIAVAAIVLLLPPRVGDDVVAPAVLSSPAAAVTHNVPGAADVGDVVAANIFSLSRTAPARRYDPLTFDSEPPVATSPLTAGEPAVNDEDAVPKLYGIVGGANGGAALLRLDAATPGALLYRVGERGGAYRVEEINEQTVVLSGPAGRVVLRLARQES